MSRSRLLIENIFAYGFVGVVNGIVPFLLLPVITRLLPNAADFGVYSMYATIVGFGTPLAVLGLYDAMFREFFEKDDLKYRYDVTTTAQRMITLSALIVALALVILSSRLSTLFFGNISYAIIIIFAGVGVFLGAVKSPIQAPTRMQNQRRVFIVSGLISSLVTYLLALTLIYYGFSYFGLIYSSIIASFVLIVFFWTRNRAFFIKGVFDRSIAKELLRIGLPLLPTFLIYWVYNSMDKIMIANMLGTLDLGVYSVGSRMAQVSQLIYAGFAGGWQYFAFSTMKDGDQVELNSKVFEYLGAVTVLSFVVIYPFIRILFGLLFVGDYVSGYTVAPYLYLSPLLLMLFQIAANQFLVVKKSYLSTLTLSVGACLNIVLNLILIRHVGIEGAALATLSSFFITLILVMTISEKMDLMLYSKKIIFTLMLLPTYMFLQRIAFVENLVAQIGTMLLGASIVLYLFRSDFELLWVRIRSR